MELLFDHMHWIDPRSIDWYWLSNRKWICKEYSSSFDHSNSRSSSHNWNWFHLWHFSKKVNFTCFNQSNLIYRCHSSFHSLIIYSIPFSTWKSNEIPKSIDKNSEKFEVKINNGFWIWEEWLVYLWNQRKNMLATCSNILQLWDNQNYSLIHEFGHDHSPSNDIIKTIDWKKDNCNIPISLSLFLGIDFSSSKLSCFYV